ncbi:MAG: phosphoribosylanthranilate isomerase [Dehalococcoidales bacterium]|nr:phosphoribosylanthranilate isomerase [Dehalococcoidales bacterium]
MTRIKICGLREPAHALAAAEAGADFIGLVFAPSPRQITVEQAGKVALAIKNGGYPVQLVGVFVNAPVDEVNRITEVYHLDMVQLSGDESIEYCALVNGPVIKAVRIGSEKTVKLSKKYTYLLDTQVKGKFGGTGVTFDWSLAKPIARQVPVIIAGGLTPENVPEAIRQVAPWGVDVSSGVETDGAKDIAKIKAFIQAVRRTDDRRS